METQPRPPASPEKHGSQPSRSGWRRNVWQVVRWSLICYLLVMVTMMLLEEFFIFIPSPYDEAQYRVVGLGFEDAWFQAADGTRLHGWYVPHDHPRATVLLCHGNAGNISYRAETLKILHDTVGVSVLIFDYRGYGRSEGKPDEAGVLADARAARAWLAGKEGVAEADIVLLGRSLGGSVAVDLAAKDGARALVLESSFTSIPDVAAHYYPWLPVRRMMRTRLDAAAKIGSFHGPLIQSHSKVDGIIPYRFGRRLFEAANEPKQFVEFSDLDHNDPQPPHYYAALIAFLDDLP